MKEFAYPPLLNAKSAEKIVRRLIWRFFNGNIGVKKIRVNGQLKDKTVFSFKRPFYAADGEISTPTALAERFPSQELYVLRHYTFQGSSLPLFAAPSQDIAADLSDLDALCGYEYAYIFDKDYTSCFWVSDSSAPQAFGDAEKQTAVLIRYAPTRG